MKTRMLSSTWNLWRCHIIPMWLHAWRGAAPYFIREANAVRGSHTPAPSRLGGALFIPRPLLLSGHWPTPEISLCGATPTHVCVCCVHFLVF